MQDQASTSCWLILAVGGIVYVCGILLTHQLRASASRSATLSPSRTKKVAAVLAEPGLSHAHPQQLIGDGPPWPLARQVPPRGFQQGSLALRHWKCASQSQTTLEFFLVGRRVTLAWGPPILASHARASTDVRA
jgi:hypothetical protein